MFLFGETELKNPISISGGKINKVSDLSTALAEVAEAGFEYIDFWLSYFCDGEDAPMRKRQTVSLAAAACRIWSSRWLR